MTMLFALLCAKNLLYRTQPRVVPSEATSSLRLTIRVPRPEECFVPLFVVFISLWVRWLVCEYAHALAPGLDFLDLHLPSLLSDLDHAVAQGVWVECPVEVAAAVTHKGGKGYVYGFITGPIEETDEDIVVDCAWFTTSTYRGNESKEFVHSAAKMTGK